MDDIKTVNQAVAERIKEARKAAGLTQEELGKKVGMTKSGISKIETASFNIGLETAKKIAKATNTDPGYLIFGTDYVREEIIRLYDLLPQEKKNQILQSLREIVGDRTGV